VTVGSRPCFRPLGPRARIHSPRLRTIPSGQRHSHLLHHMANRSADLACNAPRLRPFMEHPFGRFRTLRPQTARNNHGFQPTCVSLARTGLPKLRRSAADPRGLCSTAICPCGPFSCAARLISREKLFGHRFGMRGGLGVHRLHRHSRSGFLGSGFLESRGWGRRGSGFRSGFLPNCGLRRRSGGWNGLRT